MSAKPAGRKGPATRSAGGAMVRGLVLIVVAVLLGVVVLRATDEVPAEADDQPVAATRVIVEERDDRDARARERAGEDDEAATESESEGETERGTEGADEEDATEGATEDEGGTTSSTTSSTSSTSSTTSVPGGRDPGEVNVLVANGSGVSGLAGALTEEVGAAGFETAQPANIDEDATVEGSTVYYAEGYAAEAAAVAATLSPRPPVAPMPDPAPVADLRGATVLVVVGPDLADD